MKNNSPVSRNFLAATLTLFLLVLAIFLLFDRYQFLKTKRDLHTFFDNGLNHFVIFSAYRMGTPEGMTEKGEKIFEKAKRNLLNPVMTYGSDDFQNIDVLYDLFNSSSKTLQGYGQVVHAHIPANPNIGGPTRVWFVVSAGPSGAEVDIDETTEADGVHCYEITSQPYHITNGIHSVGYLYTDTNGVKAGDTPLVGIKP